MDQKAKFIIIGLAVFTLAALLLFGQACVSKQNVVRERDDLKTENTTLNAKIDKLAVSLRGYESKISALNKDLEGVSKQKDELEKKYEELNKEKEALDNKLKRQATASSESATVSSVEAIPQTNDEYWAQVLRAKNELELQLSTLRSDFKSMQIANEQALREKVNIDLDVNNLKRENDDLKRQMNYNQKLMDSMARGIVREKNDKKLIQDNYRILKSENATLIRQLQALNDRKITLEKRIQELQEGKGELEHKVTEGEAQVTELKKSVDNIKSIPNKATAASTLEKLDSSVELPAIVVKPLPDKAAGAEDARPKDKVVAVNKENNFVITDLGQDSGLKVGDVLQVCRGDRVIARVEAVQVRGNISACDIKKEAEPIKAGDIVAG